jgi:predicted HicB family RNase H-like nuclease
VLLERGNVVFKGSSLAELQREMKRAVDAYFSRCREEGVEPSAPLPDVPDASETSPFL